MSLKICKQCKMPFDTKGRSRTYCSEECRKEHEREKANPRSRVNKLQRTMKVLDRIGMNYKEYQDFITSGKGTLEDLERKSV